MRFIKLIDNDDMGMNQKILFFAPADSELIDTFGSELALEGFCLHYEHDTAQWLSCAQTVSPDVILMQVTPEAYREPYNCCYELRLNETTEHIPVLLLGQTYEHNAHEALSHYLLEGLHAGANDYLQTPFQMPELLGKIKAALRLRASMAKAQVLANQLNKVNEELYQRNIQIEKELYIARQLQQSLLPMAIAATQDEDGEAPVQESGFTRLHYQDKRLRISGIYLPCDALGGDLYDVLKFKDNTLGISITDVSGHGVPAGFITAIFKTSLYRITHQMQGNPAEVLFHLNNELFDLIKTGDYVTSLYLRINLETLVVDCAGAGHPYPMVYNACEKRITRLQKNGTPLVWVRDIEYPEDHVQLHPGDKLFLFTDGVSELKNPKGVLFGEENLTAVLLAGIAQNVPHLNDYVIEALSDYTEGTPLEDDISMVLIEAL